MNKKTPSAIPFWGAAFLMATSAVGPGFITQTTVFTRDLLASFGFIILISIIMDIVAQVNIWRIITVSGKRAPELANTLVSGLGHVLTLLVVSGGLAFNIGNIAGAGMGFETMTNIPIWVGVLGSAAVATGIFIAKDAGKAMDWFMRILGLLLIALMLYVLLSVDVPVKQVLLHTFWPEKISAQAIVTLVGGTVGGYISFAGAHRLLDAGLKGKGAVRQVTQSSVRGILLASLMRCLLFLTVLGVVLAGAQLHTANPPAAVFEFALGTSGKKLFGLVLWAAAISSVVGCAYTSISFLRTMNGWLDKNHKTVTLVFIWLSAFIFLLIGQPVRVLIMAGTVNGFILPVALAVLLIIARRKSVFPTYKHPLWLQIGGWTVVLFMTAMGISMAF